MLSEDDIAARVAEIGAQISRDYAGKRLVMVSVLKGSVVFMADLMRAVTVPAEIDFMSGGEQSFVAICIYFAILKLKPAPFCILDEIDAALDEVNVKKYAQYLKKFTDKTQFVLVTHRRSAMEEANVLYGVTMQEDGISKLLKMEQVDIENTAQ